MNNKTAAPQDLFDVDVVDSAGDKIGTVDGVWVDDATDELEFVGVKLGFIAGKTHLIPLANSQVADETITVPYSRDQIKDAPSFGTDDELSPEDEDGIYRHYGLDRSNALSPTGLPEDGSTMNDANTGRSGEGFGDMPTPPTHAEMTLGEENLVVGKRQVEAGRVRLRKVVHTSREEVPVDLRREEVEIERVPATESGSDGTAFGEQEIDIPLMREEAVVNKESHATEQVRLNKAVETETQSVGGEVRSEDVEIDRDTESDIRGRRGDRV